MKCFIIAILLLSFSINGFCQSLKVQGKSIYDANGNKVILRGIGLGGWMLQEPYMLQLSGAAIAQYDIRKKITELIGEERTMQFYESWLQNHCTKADIDSLASWGFNSVRLPMHYDLFTLPAHKEPMQEQHTWLKKGFELTDSLLSWCKANKIYLILDLHAAPGGQGNDKAISDRDSSKASLWESTSNKKKTAALWKQLAQRYANEPWLGAYNLINEPNWGFQDAADKHGCAETSNKPLKNLLNEITAAIRSVDTHHMIIVEGNCWGNNYEGMLPFEDKNTVLSFHKYWNYTDQNSIQKFIDYREKYNIPIWMGESGENSNTWFTNTIELLEKNGIGWAWWPLKKSGINNPLQIKINTGYQSLINYWKGKATKPAVEEASSALMEYAANTHISRNIFRRDVIDAMFRQVHSTALMGFEKNLVQDNAILFASDYDLGRSSYAYQDIDSGNYWVSTTKRTDWNKGWQYRNDGVDIETCTDSITNGYHIGWIEDAEWIHYTVFAKNDGMFNIKFRYAAKESDGSIQVFINNERSSVTTLPSTLSWSNWRSVSGPSVLLKKGPNTIKILMLKGGFNLNYLQFIYQNTTENLN